MLRNSDRLLLGQCYEQICNGAISQMNLRSLLMGLRPYLIERTALRDLADLAAHPNERDKGLGHSRVAHVWGITTLMHGIGKGEIFRNRMPQYAFEIISNALKYPLPEMKKRKGFSGKRSSLEFREAFLKSEDGFFELEQRQLSQELQEDIDSVIGTVHHKPTFITHELILQLAKEGVRMRVCPDDQAFISQSTAMELQMLVFLHETKLKLFPGVSSVWYLSTEETETDALSIRSSSSMPQQKNFYIDIQIAASSLIAEQHCTEKALGILKNKNTASTMEAAYAVTSDGKIGLSDER